MRGGIGKRALIQSQRVTLILANVFIFSFALDFRGSVGGSPIQFAMAGLNVTAFLLLALYYRFSMPSRGFRAIITWGWILFLITGSIAAVMSEVPFGQYIRVAFSYTLFFEGFLFVWWSVRDTNIANLIVNRMILAAAVSMIFTVFWGFFFTDKSASIIHFAIVSQTIPFLMAAAGYDLFFARKQCLISSVWLTLGMGIIILSGVRGMILALGAVILGIVIACLWFIVKGYVIIPKPLKKGIGGVVIITAVALALTLAANPQIIYRWIINMTGPSHYVNLWARVAAVAGQWHELTSGFRTWVLGCGFGHNYTRDSYFASLIIPYTKSISFQKSLWYPGEFMWITPLFYAGFIIGSISVGMLLIGGLLSIRRLAQILRYQRWRFEAYRPSAIGALGFMGFLGISLTSNPFMQRLAPMFMGICLGLFLIRVNLWEPLGGFKKR